MRKILLAMAALSLILPFGNASAKSATSDAAELSVRFPTTWMISISNAFADFQDKRTENWPCYIMSASQSIDGSIIVTFESDKELIHEEDVNITMGDSGACGPTLIYKMSSDGKIISINGIR